MYKQKVELMEGRIVTGTYRILGTLFGLPNLGISDLLNRQDRPFVPLGDPRLYAPGGEAPQDDELRGKTDFLAVPKDEIWWILGGNPGKPSGTIMQDRSLAVLYGDHLLRGRLKVTGHIRTSDYIAQRAASRPFDTLFDVTLCRLEPGTHMIELPALEEFEFVTVNLQRAAGVSELATVPVAKADDGVGFVLEEENEWVQ